MHMIGVLSRPLTIEIKISLSMHADLVSDAQTYEYTNTRCIGTSGHRCSTYDYISSSAYAAFEVYYIYRSVREYVHV